MKSRFCIANWKMKLSVKESISLADKLRSQLNFSPLAEVVVCPSFPVLSAVGEVIAGSEIKLGAQNASWLVEGSLTGEVSPLMLKELGVKYVIIGHSERRQYLAESDEMINKKVEQAVLNELIPILCVGETAEERDEGRAETVIKKQLTSALAGLTVRGRLLVAYEPVWAIGTGKPVSVDEVEKMVDFIYRQLPDWPLWVLYGGSVDAENIDSFASSNKIHGVLVGGASLSAEEFIKIIKAFN